MKATIKKWGNSAAVRIPATIMKATGLSLGDTVEIHETDGKITIEPVRQTTYDLEDLLKKITKKNIHKPMDWGPPVGKEIW